MYADGTPISKHDGITPVVVGDNLYYFPSLQNGPLRPQQDEDEYNSGETFIYGLMYTWAAASRKSKIPNINEGEGLATSVNSDAIANPKPADIEQVGVQGICPNGWHLPSDLEMNDLEKVFSNDQNGLYYDNSSDPAYKPEPWDDIWRINQEGSRGRHGRSLMSPYLASSLGLSKTLCNGEVAGFSAYPVGYIYNNKVDAFDRLGDYWTSSRGSFLNTNNELSINRAWYRSFMNGTTSEGVTRRSQATSLFMSVRCKKD